MRQLMSKRLRQWQAKAKGQKARDVIHGHLARYNLIGLLDWWYKSSKAWRRKQDLIARGLPGTVRHTLRTKWKTWQAQASDGNDVEFRAEERAMVLRHFESRAVFGAVRTWKLMAAVAKGGLLSILNGALHADRNRLAVGFKAWVLLRVLKSRGMMGALRGAAHSRRDAIKKFIGRLREESNGGRRLHNKKLQAAQRLRNRGLAKAWGGWTELTQIYAALARRGASAMGLSKAKRREAAWVSWKKDWTRSRKVRLQIAHMMMGKRRSSFEKLRAHASPQEKANRLLRAALLHQQATAWKKWDAQCSKRRAERARLYARLRPAYFPFKGWARVAEKLRFAGSAERKNLAMAAAQRMRSKAAPSFISWREWAAKRRMGDNNGLKLIASRLRGARAHGFEVWKVLAKKRAGGNRYMMTAEGRARRAAAARAWIAWTGYRGLAPLLAEAEAFHEPKAKADAFDAWASYLDKLHSLFASSAAALPQRDGVLKTAAAAAVHAVATSPVNPRVAAFAGAAVSPRSPYSPRDGPNRPRMRFH